MVTAARTPCLRATGHHRLRARTDAIGRVEDDTVAMSRRATVTGRVVVVMLLGAAVCFGCGAPVVDKLGGRGAIVALRLGAADPGEPSLAHFIDALDRTTAGRMAVAVDRTTYYSETRGGPALLAPDLQAGAVDLALIPSRDWAAAGDPGFVALQAPFAATSTIATTTLARSDIARKLLEDMAAYGAVGLGLIPGEPRRLLTREPVVHQSDLSGLRIRVSDSARTMALVAALGADPVQGMTAADVRAALHDGALDGAETAPVYLSQNGYNLSAPYLSSFALIPKFEVLAASSRAWQKLSVGDREAISSAAAETVAWQASRLAADEAAELSVLCGNGLVVVAPLPSSLAAWRSAAARHEAAPAGAIVGRVRAVALQAGSGDMASVLPPGCRLATSAAQAREMHLSAQPHPSPSPAPPAGPSIPPGTYQETVTAEQFAAGGLNGPDFAEDVVYTWVFGPDGTFVETQEPDYPDQGPQSGRYTVVGDRLSMSYLPGPDGVTLPPERARWSFYAGTLTFSHVQVQDRGTVPLYEQPWHKVR